MQKLSDWGKAWDDYFDAQNIDIGINCFERRDTYPIIGDINNKAV